MKVRKRERGRGEIKKKKRPYCRSNLEELKREVVHNRDATAYKRGKPILVSSPFFFHTGKKICSILTFF